MADVRRLIELSMVPPLAQEVAKQIDASGGAFDPGDIPEDSTATTVAGLVGDFNALLAVLRGA